MQSNMQEETRKVLNKSIDVLHKLSKGKTTRKEARQELSALLAGHFLMNSKSQGIDINQKVKLQCYLDEALSIVDRLDSGQAPLYEGILMMNKVIAKKETEPVLPLDETTISSLLDGKKLEDSIMISDQFDRSGKQKEEEAIRPVKIAEAPKPAASNIYTQLGIQELMQEVLRNKEQFEKSIVNLNESLLHAGFELKVR